MAAVIAIDCETAAFAEPTMGYRTRTSPFVFPPLVIGTFYDPDSGSVVLPASDACARFRTLLEGDAQLVFHNITFDVGVFTKHSPALLPLVVRAVDANRFHDTRILEVLIQIARGSSARNQKQLVLYPTLEKLALKRAGMKLTKDPGIRLRFGDFLGRESLLPQEFLDYAKEDAEATWKVYESQRREAQIYASDAFCSGPLLDRAQERFGVLSEQIQVRAALAFAWLEQFPIRVDLPHLNAIKTHLSEEEQRFQRALVGYGWARYTKPRRLPGTPPGQPSDSVNSANSQNQGKFHFQSKKIRSILLTYAKAHELPTPRTLTGLLSLKYDDWSPHLPKISEELHANPFVYTAPPRAPAKRKRKASSKPGAAAAPAQAVAAVLEPEQAQGPSDAAVSQMLAVWLRYMRVRKLLATYIWPYSSSEFHYPQYSIIGARSTRTSCRTPNAQNVSKRKDGIRAAFVPAWTLNGKMASRQAGSAAEVGQEGPPGQTPGQPQAEAQAGASSPEHEGEQFVLVERDYDSAELRALAQVYFGRFGRSVLGDALNAGLSPHDQTAEWLDARYRDLPEVDRTRLRQAAKAVNFGLPGGLGARTLAKYARTTWGVSLSEEEARQARQAVLNRDPQLREYLTERIDDLALCKLVARNCGCTWQHLLTALACWRGLPGTERDPNWSLFRKRLMQWKVGTFSPEGLNVPPGFNPKFDLTKSHCRTLTGFTRGNCTYTQWHNTPFQSLVASGAKLAMWELFKAFVAPANVQFQPYVFVHDSIAISCKRSDFEEADRLLDQCMVKGMKELLPDVAVTTVGSGPLLRWGKDTNPWGK